MVQNLVRWCTTGESHCLSYAHKTINIFNTEYRVVPRITYGAKRFISRKINDSFKAITKENFEAIDLRSKIFISFGKLIADPMRGSLKRLKNSTSLLKILFLAL